MRSSFRTSFVLLGRGCQHGRSRDCSRSLALGCDEFNARAGAVFVGEDLVGDAAYISFVDRVDFFELSEELTPVAEAGLILG
jgi:hypothetical protein